METPTTETQYVPTPEKRVEVCRMVASGWTPPEIARHLGISKKILRKHFSVELKNGEELVKKFAKLEFINKAFDKGSVPALKILAGMSDGKAPEGDGSEKPSKPAPVGKKAQRKADAIAINAGVFATPSPPKTNGKHN